jgi:hypothetical protein
VFIKELELARTSYFSSKDENEYASSHSFVIGSTGNEENIGIR